MFSILFSIFILFMTFCYWKAPEKIIETKTKYVLSFLLFSAFYWFLNGIGIIILNKLKLLNLDFYFVFSVFVFILLLYVLYLFFLSKRVTRNIRQHINFFLFFTTLLSMTVAGFLILIAYTMN
jgi:hypothetical protein